MPNKNDCETSKQIPKILRTPMTYDLDFLWEAMIAKLTGKEVDARIMDRQVRQFRERLDAVRQNYDLPRSELGLTDLELQLCVAQFPEGFRPVAEGFSAKGHSRWTAGKKLRLVSYIDQCRERGLTIGDAAKGYLCLHVDRMRTPRTIMRAYFKFKRQLSTGDLTAQEKIDLARIYSDRCA